MTYLTIYQYYPKPKTIINQYQSFNSIKIKQSKYSFLIIVTHLIQTNPYNLIIGSKSNNLMESEMQFQQFYNLRQHQTYFLRYLGKDNTWINHQCPKSMQQVKDIPRTISTLTFNVLTDSFKSKPYRQETTYSKIRYAYIISQAQKINPDVMSFNEVSNNFYQMIKQAKWIQKAYYISKLTSQPKGFGNLICTKIEPIFVDKLHIQNLPRTVQAVFIPVKKNKIICFCSVHLTSYDTQIQKRDKQFTGIVNYLDRYKNLTSGAILLGDMNFHSQGQRFIFEKHNFKDSWTETHQIQNNPGYTFDGQQNWLINELYWGFERRRMRLDRILYKCPSIKIKEINVIFDQPIFGDKKKVNHHTFLEGGLLAIADFIGVNINRQKQNYLFPSDHFGLFAKLNFTNQIQ